MIFVRRGEGDPLEQSERLPRGWMATSGKEPDCFYCYKPLGLFSIQWMGSYETLWLHPKCTHDLVLRLGRDLWELESRQEYGDVPNPARSA